MKGKILKIRELGDPIIRKVAKAVSVKEIKSKKFQKFVADLVATCKAKNGMGIAAPQVGESKRVFIVCSRPNKRYKKAPKMEPLIIINPKIIFKSKKILKDWLKPSFKKDGSPEHLAGQDVLWEGCLSIPGIRGLVPRYVSIDVEFTDINGNPVARERLGGFPARIFQHEFDHLNGIVFIDRTDSKDIMTESEFNKIVKKRK